MKTIDEKDCFALRRNKCKILNVKKCQGTECRFFKTEEQNKQDKEKAKDRICSLSRERRKSICETYYGGRKGLFEV